VQWATARRFVDQNGDAYNVMEMVGVEQQIKIRRRFPESVMIVELDGALRRHEAEFGLTPSARARIVVPEPEKPQDEKAKFFASRTKHF